MFQELEQEGIEPFEVQNLWLSSNEPDTYVDITDTIDIKIKALEQHVSQGGAEAEPWVRIRARGDRRAGGLHVRRGVQGVPVRRRSVGGMMDEPTPQPDEPEERIDLTSDERADIEADLHDLESMRRLFASQGVKGVVIACQDCGANHFYEWELLQDNLDHMLQTGEPRMHEPAFDIQEEEYIHWDYGKGYIDALADTGLEPDRTHRGRFVPVVPDALRDRLPVLPAMRPVARRGADVPRARRPRHGRARGAGVARPRRLRTVLGTPGERSARRVALPSPSGAGWSVSHEPGR